MAKISSHGGPTVGSVRGRVLLPAVAQVELVDPVQPISKEDPWPGSSSSTSPEKPPKSDVLKSPSRPKRARTTGARSRSTEASTTAPTATTSGPVTGG